MSSSEERKKYENATYQQWLEHPTTVQVLEKLRSISRPTAGNIKGLDGEREFLARALWRSGVDDAVTTIETVPYPYLEVGR